MAEHSLFIQKKCLKSSSKSGRLMWLALLCFVGNFFSLVGTPDAFGQELRSGSCAKVDFSKYRKENQLLFSQIARVTRHESLMYTDATGNKAVARLPFNLRVAILDEQQELVKISIANTEDKPNLVGWAKKGDLLCQDRPLKSVSGLEMKFIIKTPDIARNEQQSEPKVPLFHDPDLKGCSGGSSGCKEGFSRYHMYFIFDQSQDALLLADGFRLDAGDDLLGWVAKSDGIVWDNAFGLRPHADLRSPDGKGEGTICTYQNLTDAVARNGSACQPIVGGKSWLQSPTRIPVLGIVDAAGNHIAPGSADDEPGQRLFYQVALGRPGLVARRVGKDRVAISKQLANKILPGVTSLKAKKQVDIFFLLDATASMGPIFDAVRGTNARPGVIQQIIKSMETKPEFAGTKFRFGFRVYRDSYADNQSKSGIWDGIGEGYPLGAECSGDDNKRGQLNGLFREAIAKVEVSQTTLNDDYQENLYGGLKQVLQHDIVNCPDNLKILFVIGDHGNQSDLRDKQKYVAPVSKDSLLKLLRGSQQPGTKTNNVIPLFIHTPYQANDAKNKKAYRKAYEQFAAQSKYLLENSLPAGSGLDEHFFNMDEENLLDRMVGTVEKMASSALIDEIILDIRGGDTMSAIIKRLQRKRVDIPGLFWHILKQGACGELGKQCQEQIYDTTQVSYIEADDKVVEELRISSSDLATWIDILDVFEGHVEIPEEQLRRALIKALVLGLQKKLGQFSLDLAGETPAQYVQRLSGLPVRRHSPLLGYKLIALAAKYVARTSDGTEIVVDRNDEPFIDAKNRLIPVVPDCELSRLAIWANTSKEVLEVVQREYFQPQIVSTPYRPRDCPDATANGQALQRIARPIKSTPLGPDRSYRFTHNSGGQLIYWVPQQYLP